MKEKTKPHKNAVKKRLLKWIGEAAAGLLILTAFLFLAPSKQSLADVIWTPEDSFYEKHYEDCEYIGRSYCANGSKGYITVWDSPDKKTALDYIANGPSFFIYMSYKKAGSGTWGQVEYLLDENGVPENSYSWESKTTVGWIKMDELTLVYDGISFAEEHASEIQTIDESAAPEITMPDSGTIYFWVYPGSEDSCATLTELPGEMVIDQTYEDHNGVLWGHSSYYYGYRNFWINLNNPGEERPEIWQPDTPKLTPPASHETLESLPKTGISSLLLPLTVAGLIILTILITAIIIRNMAQKKKRTQ